MMRKPLCIDLFAGTFAWSAGWHELGGYTVGFDIEHLPHHGPVPAGDDLVIQDVLTLNGAQFRRASLILASPPCQFFSYTAMPWSRAKQLAANVLADAAQLEQRLALFRACFRIQREASEAAGHHIPMVVENVRGAGPWVGRSAANFGSFHLYGDVPALMPMTMKAHKVPGFRFDGNGGSFQSASVEGVKTTGHVNQRDGYGHTRHLTNQAESDGVKQGGDWFGPGEDCSISRRTGSKSSARKAASARIAMIPLPLSRWIAQVYFPENAALLNADGVL